MKWEGVDDAGTRLAPGAYLLRVSVDAGMNSGGAAETLRAVAAASGKIPKRPMARRDRPDAATLKATDRVLPLD